MLICFVLVFFSEFSEGSAIAIAGSVFAAIVIILLIGGAIIAVSLKIKSQQAKKTESELSKGSEFPSVSVKLLMMFLNLFPVEQL